MEGELDADTGLTLQHFDFSRDKLGCRTTLLFPLRFSEGHFSQGFSIQSPKGRKDNMEEELDANSGLDYAVFQFSFRQNSYEALAFSEGRNEKISSGYLDQLLLHLPALEGLDIDLRDSFKLQPYEELTNLSWFRKSTLKIFLNFVNAPEEFKKITAIQNELCQLEDTRSFHVTLYTKDQQSHLEDCTSDNGFLKEAEPLQRVKVETVTSDATKNELLRALDLRLMALKEELVNEIENSMGIRCSKGQFSDLVAFVDHFGNRNLRNILLKYLTLKYDNTDTSLAQPELSMDPDKCIEDTTGEKIISRAASLSAVRNGISPARIAQAERESPTESESSNSSDEMQAFAERSRPVIRSASPRRSASPMRRIQIGRSGSRRTTAITIKSLNYFPAREKISCNREADDNGNEDESLEQLPKKSDNSVMRMSVQDRINLFESKQRDQILDIQKKNSGTEAPFGNKKSVLRRWSSGVGDSSFECPQEISADRNSSNNLVLEHKNKSIEEEDNIFTGVCVKSDDNVAAMFPLDMKERLTSPLGNPQDLIVHQSEDAPDRALASTEWTRQKEAELDQLMKMMEIKNANSGILTSGSGGDQELCMEQKRDFYSQYKEKRDEKLKTVNSGKRTEKEAKSKVMPSAIDQRNVEMVKKAGVSAKLNLSVQQQKVRRNSSPPVLSSKNTSNLIAPKKTPPKTASTAVAKRNSLPLTPTQRPAGAVPPKASPRTTSCTPNRRKPILATSPTTIGPQTERPRKTKGTKSVATETKTELKSQEENKQKAVTKDVKTPKTKSPVILVDDAGHIPTKPSFYNKVTRKGSVVPLEPKSYLKKGTGGSGVGTAKAKPLLFDDPIKNSEPPQEAEMKEPGPGISEIIAPLPLLDVVQHADDAEVNREDTPSDAEACPDNAETNDMHVVEDDSIIQLSESPVVEIQQEEVFGISSAAWVEADHQARHEYSQNGHPQTIVPGDIVPVTTASPRVRHSLSQMLQADSTESDIIEWGNAENPPALVYQKDAPKGLKRLLKFARKSKAESNATGLSSPSVFSDGEEETEESKAAHKKSGDVLSRRVTSKTKISGKPTNLLSESFDGGNSSKRVNDHLTTHDMLSASMINPPSGLHKIREGSGSSVSSSSKGSRSFFSLSTFRSSKSGDAKLR